MPLFPYPRPTISQRVSNRKFGDATLGQVATLASFSVEFDAVTNELNLLVKTSVTWYGLVDGELAEPVPAETRSMKPEPVYLHANNNCAVYFNPHNMADVRNGEVLYYKEILPPTLGKPVTVWRPMQGDGELAPALASLEEAPEPLLLQGDAFAAQLEQPLVLAAMIRHHMAAADKAPFNRYA